MGSDTFDALVTRMQAERARADAAEARVSELERERDEAREALRVQNDIAIERLNRAVEAEAALDRERKAHGRVSTKLGDLRLNVRLWAEQLRRGRNFLGEPITMEEIAQQMTGVLGAATPGPADAAPADRKGDADA